MKKYFILVSFPLFLTACSHQITQQSSVPLDMQTVQDYQQRVSSGKTVDANAKTVDETLNQSDKRPKVVVRQAYPPMIHFGYGYHPYYW